MRIPTYITIDEEGVNIREYHDHEAGLEERLSSSDLTGIDESEKHDSNRDDAEDDAEHCRVGKHSSRLMRNLTVSEGNTDAPIDDRVPPRRGRPPKRGGSRCRPP